MGGVVPLGYRVESRKLLIEPTEAQTVRRLFERYLALGSVRALAEEAEATELRGRMTKGSASTQVGKPFGRGNLYHLLSNPIYIGKIRHRDLIHDGEHQPIIDTDIFARVQALLAEQAPARSSPENQTDVHLLTGLVYDDTGDRLSPAHATKNGKRYRYYVSNRLVRGRKKGNDGWRIPAGELESIVDAQLNQILNDHTQLADWIRDSGLTDQIEAAIRGIDRRRASYADAGGSRTARATARDLRAHRSFPKHPYICCKSHLDHLVASGRRYSGCPRRHWRSAPWRPSPSPCRSTSSAAVSRPG